MQIFTLRHGIRRLPRNLLLAAEKRGTARFFAKFVSISGLILNFTTYETIKSSHCELPFMIILSIMT